MRFAVLPEVGGSQGGLRLINTQFRRQIEQCAGNDMDKADCEEARPIQIHALLQALAEWHRSTDERVFWVDHQKLPQRGHRSRLAKALTALCNAERSIESQ